MGLFLVLLFGLLGVSCSASDFGANVVGLRAFAELPLLVSGRVADAAGAGVEVGLRLRSVAWNSALDSRPEFVQQWETRSDDAGRFEFRGVTIVEAFELRLGPGEYLLVPQCGPTAADAADGLPAAEDRQVRPDGLARAWDPIAVGVGREDLEVSVERGARFHFAATDAGPGALEAVRLVLPHDSLLGTCDGWRVAEGWSPLLRAGHYNCELRFTTGASMYLDSNEALYAGAVDLERGEALDLGELALSQPLYRYGFRVAAGDRPGDVDYLDFENPSELYGGASSTMGSPGEWIRRDADRWTAFTLDPQQEVHVHFGLSRQIFAVQQDSGEVVLRLE